MTELIKELTLLARAARVYLESKTDDKQPTLPLIPGETAASESKPRKRAAKAEAAPSPADILPPSAPVTALPDMTEEQSGKAVYDVCAAFVQRFAKATPDGRTTALALLAEKFKAAAIKDLAHSQRLQFIQLLNDKIAAADKA